MFYGASGSKQPRPSSSCPFDMRNRRRLRVSMRAPMTTLRSRSRWENCWPGFGLLCDGPLARSAMKSSRLVTSGWISAGEQISLTATEYDLLKVLVRHAGLVRTHRQLIHEIWGTTQYQDAVHLLRVTVSNLRRKLVCDPRVLRRIVTEPGVGYRLRTNADWTEVRENFEDSIEGEQKTRAGTGH